MAMLCSYSTIDAMTSQSLHVVYLALGSNLGDRHAAICQALQLIGERIGTIEAQSSMMQTEPWGFDSTNWFLNMCVRVLTTLSPESLLNETQSIERCLGRTSKSVAGQYHDRIIDIDILMYDDLHITTPQLTLPHPLMHERDFVMVPLREILPIDEQNI